VTPVSSTKTSRFGSICRILTPERPPFPLHIVRLGLQRAGPAASPEPAGDGGGIDAEDAGDLADRALVVIDRRDDPLAEIRRVGAHDPGL
jgi:hypothetical protein